MKKVANALRSLVALGLWVALGVFTLCAILSWVACTPAPIPAPTQGIANTPDGSKTKGGSETTPVPTAEPTAVLTPTSTPTPEPTETPEPTATPIPEGWYVDPRGIIPPDVEVLIPDDGHPAREEVFCIANVQGATMLQYWTKDGLQKEWPIPAEMAEPDKGININAGTNTFQKGDISCGRKFTSDPFSGYYWFYQDAQGRTLFFECKSGYGWPGGIIIATMDGKAVWYTWGDDFYLYHDYGTDAEVDVRNGWIIVNGGVDGGLPEDIQWTKKQL